MILVLLGTFPLPFPRPLRIIEKLIKEGFIKEDVIVQNGHTTFDSQYMTLIPFLTLDELMDLYQKADLIISQAGTGSIVKGLKLKKKIISIARLEKYGEVIDNHQLELVKEFGNLNYLIPWYEHDELQDLIIKSRTFEPVPFPSNKGEIINYLSNYIDNL
ncbi:glycosyltransferase [Pararhodonellum marinum]|uniref:glycosyltransferase n=1 Tax=Pararhodonellum marinum TaxID=2755358 RepID=UPI00188E615E|nr:glycosyltransferase [Pararhodonellum marinum]